MMLFENVILLEDLKDTPGPDPLWNTQLVILCGFLADFSILKAPLSPKLVNSTLSRTVSEFLVISLKSGSYNSIVLAETNWTPC